MTRREGAVVPTRLAATSTYTRLVGLLVVATFVLRLWSVRRWSWNSDDWIYLHDASVQSFLPYVFQNYNGHFMPGQFVIVWVLNALAPLDHGAVAVVTAVWAALLAGLWALALRDLWGTGPVTWAALLLVTLSPLMVHPTMWWAAALQTLALQTCFAACLYFAARLVRTGGELGTVGLVVSYAAGLVMWEKALFLVLPIVVILLHATPGPWREALRRYRGTLVWLAGLSAGYVLVFLAAVRLSGPASENAVRLDVVRSPSDAATFFYDLWAHLLAPGLLGGPWGTLPIPDDYDSHPTTAVSVVALVALLALAGWLLRRDRRAWLPLAAAVLYAAAAWGTILFSSRYEITSWHRLGYERYAIDAFVVLIVLMGAAAARPRPPESAGRAAGPRWAGVVAVGALAVSLVVASTVAVDRFGVSPARPWLANLERGVGGDSVTLVDRYAPDEVMPATFWADKGRLSYLLAPWREQVHFQGPASELRVVDDEGRVALAAFGPSASAPAGPVADCGYAVEVGVPQTVDVQPDLFAYDWVLKIDAFSAGAGTLLVRGEQELDIPVPAGVSSQMVAFSGTADALELEMAEGSATACVTAMSVGSVSAVE
jgi:hypothetical protein